MSHVELYQDANHDWRWRRIADNGNVTADSGQGYSRRIDCLAQAETQGVPIVTVTEKQPAYEPHAPVPPQDEECHTDGERGD